MSQTRRKTSQLWNFFTILDSEFATCDVCQHKLSYRTSISNLKKHLRKKHHTFLDRSNGDYPLSIKKKLSTDENGDIEDEHLVNDSDLKSGADTEQVPVIVEFVQANETVECEKASPEASEAKRSACSANSQKQTNIAELYERIAASACLEEKSTGYGRYGAKDKFAGEVQERHVMASLQVERALKRKILETELEMKKEELNFKKSLFQIQLEHEMKVNSLKLKMLERDLNSL